MEDPMETELWKDIPGYEGKYQASSLGRIRSLDRYIQQKSKRGRLHPHFHKGQVLKPGRFCKSGPVSVVLGHGAIGSPVHQLIALTFLGPCPEGMEVLHNNGDPTDNRSSNLRYGTKTENILDVFRQGGRWRKLNTDDVEAIRFGNWCGISSTELSLMFNVSYTTIRKVLTGRTFSCLK